MRSRPSRASFPQPFWSVASATFSVFQVRQLVGKDAAVTAVHLQDDGEGDGRLAGGQDDDENSERLTGNAARHEVLERDEIEGRRIAPGHHREKSEPKEHGRHRQIVDERDVHYCFSQSRLTARRAKTTAPIMAPSRTTEPISKGNRYSDKKACPSLAVAGIWGLSWAGHGVVVATFPSRSRTSATIPKATGRPIPVLDVRMSSMRLVSMTAKRMSVSVPPT